MEKIYITKENKDEYKDVYVDWLKKNKYLPNTVESYSTGIMHTINNEIGFSINDVLDGKMTPDEFEKNYIKYYKDAGNARTAKKNASSYKTILNNFLKFLNENDVTIAKNIKNEGISLRIRITKENKEEIKNKFFEWLTQKEGFEPNSAGIYVGLFSTENDGLDSLLNEIIEGKIPQEKFKEEYSKYRKEKNFKDAPTRPDNMQTYLNKFIEFVREKEAEIDEKQEKIGSSYKNFILYGPPGTGKTYHTKRMAVEICESFNTFENEISYEKETFPKYKKLVEEERIVFTTFHQSYGYEEFVEGIKASINKENGEIYYEVKPGIFKTLCEKAREHPKNPYVLIIDEINRGNISKIFGELITLIEESKREGEIEEISVELPYSSFYNEKSERFSVPKNVYIIGTMNTADRSIALIDTALRRRFQFIEMMPDYTVLRSLGIKKVIHNNEELDIIKMLKTINKRIEALHDREHQIGHAFFIKLKDFAENERIDTLATIFKNNIIPLLQEYFYEDYSKIMLVLGDNDKEVDDKYKFIKEIPNEQNLFRGRVSDEEYAENRYVINDKDSVEKDLETENAFKEIISYKKIYDTSVGLKKQQVPQEEKIEN